jgi:hypothetical protein
VKTVLATSLGVIVGGPIGGLVAGLSCQLPGLVRRRRAPDSSPTLVLLLLLVQLRSGLSVLAALGEASQALPEHRSLRAVARVARVSGLVSAIPFADERLRPVMAQLARAQATGASLSGVVRRMLDAELAAARTVQIARARTLPVRLMIPVTLFMLPGLVLLLYAPSLLGMFEDLTGVLW